MQPLLLLTIAAIKPHIIWRHTRSIYRLLFNQASTILNLTTPPHLTKPPRRSCPRHHHGAPLLPHLALHLQPGGSTATATAVVQVGGAGGEGAVFGFVFELLLRLINPHFFGS